jgi:hypothetical protein
MPTSKTSIEMNGESVATNCSLVFNYGGGRQTVAMCIMIAKGVLPKPNVVVMADTSRENPMTWDYLEKYTQPMMTELGCPVEIARHELAKVDLYANNGNLLLPVYTKDGKLPTFCSTEWKKRVVRRHLRASGHSGGTQWLGLAMDEKRRWKKHHGKVEGKWLTVCPLVDLMINTDACLSVIKSFGWPEPHQSACWMCPHKKNAEWREIRDNHPAEWKRAVELDKKIRASDDHGGVFLHRDRVPLDQANLDAEETPELVRQCSLGMCFV